MARYGIGYKPKKTMKPWVKKKRLMNKRRSSLYRKVISIIGKPDVKYAAMHYTCSDPGLQQYLKVYNLHGALDIPRTSVSKAFILPETGTSVDDRISNKITVRKIHIKYFFEIDTSALTGDAAFNQALVRVIVFSGLKNPDFSSGSGSAVINFFRYNIDYPTIINNVDARDFTVWYDKTIKINDPNQHTVSGSPVAASRVTSPRDVNIKYKGKFRQLVFEGDTDRLPKDQERQQLYIAVFGMCPELSHQALMGFFYGQSTVYYTDS